MKVELLNVGWMTAARGIWRTGEEEPERPVRVPVPAYVIETETERILLHTGLNPDAVADKEAHYRPGPISPSSSWSRRGRSPSRSTSPP
jgi:hypothetical protein